MLDEISKDTLLSKANNNNIWKWHANDFKPNISTQSTLVFLLLQNFESTPHVRSCCVIRAWWSDFNLSSYLQLWISCVYQNYTAGASFGEELFLFRCRWHHIRGLITFKICHMPSYGWTMVTKIIHQLKLLQLSKFDDRSVTMAGVIVIYQKHMTT